MERTLSVPRRLAPRMPLALAGFAWSSRGRQFGWFASWIVSMPLCVAAFGAESSSLPSGSFGEWLISVRFAAWMLHIVATTELLLALFGEEPGTAKLRRAIRFAPIGGLMIAVAVRQLLALQPAIAQPAHAFPLSVLAYICTLMFVLMPFAALYGRATITRIAPLAIYLLGWSALAAAAGHDALHAPGPNEARGWLSAGKGAWVFALCAAAVFVRALHLDAQRRAHTQRNLIDSARKYRHVYYSAPVALMSVDPSGQILRWNDRSALYFRNELRQGRVNTIDAVFGSEHAAPLLHEVAETGRHHSELRLGIDGSTGVRVCVVDALLCGNAIEISLVDITDRTLLASTLEHMAYHDPLTDRMNLRGLERELATVSTTVDRGASASLFYIDLNRFKAINELFGHAAGNAVVVEVSKRLDQLLPASARVGRLGGDEFLVVLPGCGLEHARGLAQRTIACIADGPFEVDGKRLRVDASVGVVEIAPGIGMGVAELIAYANAACGEARRNGHGDVVAAETSSEHLARYRAEIDLGLRLRSSLPVERMCVYAQPIVPLKCASGAGMVMSYEVLLRERDENGKIQSPARLIAAAERYGAMRAIDRFMLERTLQHLGENRQHATSLDFMTVNLSGISLNDDRFLADACSLLGQCGDIAKKICLEITESVAMYDLKSTRRFVDRMRSLGVRIALDDFGAGHSSFAYLSELPASLIKIDGQFMLGIDRQPRNQVIVSGIRRLTEELGVACLAEWIEDVAALEFLLRVEMDYAQGFVLAKPQPIEYWLAQTVDPAPLDEARRRIVRSVRSTAADETARASPVATAARELQPAPAMPT